MDEIIAVWDENKTRADELKKHFDSMGISVKCDTGAEYPKESEIKATDAVFLSFGGDGGSVSKAADISARIKRINKSCMIVLICDREISFNVFYRPSISPCGVICRPFTRQLFESVVGELMDELQRLKNEANDRQNANLRDNGSFSAKIGGNHYSFYYSDILFFEARAKKVAVKTFGQEISYYDSLDTIAETLPPYFIRCHRSFIVNMNQIKSMHFGENTIRLKDGSAVPISRSYKGDVRRLVNIDE